MTESDKGRLRRGLFGPRISDDMICHDREGVVAGQEVASPIVSIVRKQKRD